MKSFSQLIAMKETVNQQRDIFYFWKESIRNRSRFELEKFLNVFGWVLILNKVFML